MAVTVLALVCVVAYLAIPITADPVPPKPEFKCTPGVPGLFEDSRTCRGFIMCDNFGVAFHMPCGPKTIFSLADQTCVHEWALKCKVFECQGPGIYANQESCNSFYSCDSERNSYLMTCPPGLEFNDKLNICDLPKYAQCIRR